MPSQVQFLVSCGVANSSFDSKLFIHTCSDRGKSSGYGDNVIIQYKLFQCAISGSRVSVSSLAKVETVSWGAPETVNKVRSLPKGIFYVRKPQTRSGRSAGDSLCLRIHSDHWLCWQVVRCPPSRLRPAVASICSERLARFNYLPGAEVIQKYDTKLLIIRSNFEMRQISPGADGECWARARKSRKMLKGPNKNLNKYPASLWSRRKTTKQCFDHQTRII